jgi:hypothetical protein
MKQSFDVDSFESVSSVLRDNRTSDEAGGYGLHALIIGKDYGATVDLTPKHYTCMRERIPLSRQPHDGACAG